jgi:pSer/pThr/pTyr-binding forkhead associated (FHA) protein
LVVLIIVLNHGRKKSKVQAVNVAAAIEPAPIKKAVPVIRSMSSQHLGMTVALSSQPMLIGRDAGVCRIVFREDTPGVSSKHCQIYYDENVKAFILTDLKSSYGTFLASGQKLTPNAPYQLRPKDSFYLGEKDNAIFVDLE